MRNLPTYSDWKRMDEATSVSLDLSKHAYDPKTRTFTISERDVKFDTSYVLKNPKTGNAMKFDFVSSTGPEFHKDTRWIYRSAEGYTLEVCNDPSITAKRAKAYLDHKLSKWAKDRTPITEAADHSMGEGDEVKVVGKVSHSGKTGVVHSLSEDGKYVIVKIGGGKHSFHFSDLEPSDGEGVDEGVHESENPLKRENMFVATVLLSEEKGEDPTVQLSFFIAAKDKKHAKTLLQKSADYRKNTKEMVVSEVQVESIVDDAREMGMDVEQLESDFAEEGITSMGSVKQVGMGSA